MVLSTLCLGAMLDAGVPSGAGASIVYRPVRALRVHAGAAHNGFGPGAGGGVTLAPLAGTVTPTLTVEAGRFSAAELGYDYATAHVGVELGTRAYVFYLRGGVSGVDAAWTGEHEMVTTTGAVRAVIPSLRLGFAVYFGGS